MSYFDSEAYEVEMEREERESCYHGFGECIDQNCRDHESCIGCELLYPQKEKAKNEDLHS